MSILAGLIGILALMINLAMQSQELDHKQSEEEHERALKFHDLKKQITAVNKKLQKVESTIQRERKTVAEMAELKDRQISLRDELAELKRAAEGESDAALQKLIENLKQELATLRASKDPLQERIAALEQELKTRRETKPVESVIVRPGGTGSRQARNLFFVECNSTGIVLRRKGAEPTSILRGAIGTSDVYNTFLDRVKKTGSSMVLFLVRKSGNESYRWAAGWAQSKYEVRIGKLPLPNDGAIDLSLFDR